VTLPREEVVVGLQDEYGAFEELVRSLSPDELERPSRCEGWTARDVAAHVIGSLADVTTGRFDRFGNPDTIQEVVDERKGRSAAELGDELQQSTKIAKDIVAAIDDTAWSGPAPGELGIPLSEGVEALWYDAFIHNNDIRDAVGRENVRGAGLRAAVSHLADLLSQQEWGPATLALDGLDEFPVSGGGGQRITGDPYDFVLVATGRKDPSTFGLDETVNVYREQ
jgi:uncharacterized protein (TIGR03083 family)